MRSWTKRPANAERVFDPPSPDVSIIKAACCDSGALAYGCMIEMGDGSFRSCLPEIDVVPRG